MRVVATGLAVSALLIGQAHAQLEEEDGWTGNIALSASAATGNTENTVVGLALDAAKKTGRYTHGVKAGANYAESTITDDVGSETTSTTQDEWYAQYRVDILMSDRNAAYVRVRYEENEFSGFERRAFLGGGLSRIMAEDEVKKWTLSAGPGIQYSELTEPDPITADFEESTTEFAVYAGSDLDWQLRENVKFTHDLDVTYTSENTTLSTEFGLVTQLSDSLSSRLAYSVSHETDPPAGREETDTLLSASIVYGF